MRLSSDGRGFKSRLVPMRFSELMYGVLQLAFRVEAGLISTRYSSPTGSEGQMAVVSVKLVPMPNLGIRFQSRPRSTLGHNRE
jgi:hypothetical protein